MTCSICNHEKRAEIEQACLLRNFGDSDVTLKDIATRFNVDLKDLQVHVLMHIPLEASNVESLEKTDSIAGKIKMREADILRQVMEDSYVVFKNLGDKINTIVSKHTVDSPTLGQISKATVDLYLGASQSIRDTSDKLMKMDLMVNGEKDEGLAAVASLVAAIRGN